MTVHTFVCGYFTLILNLEPSPGRFLDIIERIFRSSLSCDPLEWVSHVKKRIPVDHNGHIAYRTSTRHLGSMTSKFLPYLVLYSAQKHETFDWCWDNSDLICCSRTKSWATVYAFNVISQQSLYCRCVSEVSALRKIKRNIWRTVVINIRCQSSRVSVLYIKVSFFETKLLSLVFWKWSVFQCKYFALTTIAVIGRGLVKTLSDWSRGKQSNKINCLPRDQS